MKEFIKYSIKRIISFFLHFFWIFPIQKNKIFLMNDHSYSFSDNLKYIALFLLENDPEKYKIFFSLKNEKEIDNAEIIPVRWLSFKHFYHALTCSVLITNNGGTSYLPIRKQQMAINTWHGGGPYKVTGVRALTDYYNITEVSEIQKRNNARLIYWYKKSLKYDAKKFSYMLSSCEMCTEAEAKGLYFSDEQCLDSGMPRTDCLFQKEKQDNTRAIVFKKYIIPADHKLILYAPTFRGLFSDYKGVIDDNNLEINYQNLLSTAVDKFGGTWDFAIRLHPRLKDIYFKNKDIINMTAYPDVQELLMAADILITDYSSIMWDFSFTHKPIFLFATDINDYEVKRGFYLPPEEWPFPLATTNKDLLENIRNFEYGPYLKKVEEHHKFVGSYEKGNACETVKKIIDKHIEEKA